jgi:hypothetical protein
MRRAGALAASRPAPSYVRLAPSSLDWVQQSKHGRNMHPKNGLKLTGNTHLPDIIEDMDDGDDDAQMVLIEEVRVYADGYAPPAPEETIAALQEEPSVPEPSRMERIEREAGRVGGRAPWVLIVSGLLFGWLVVRTMRGR